MSGERKAAPAAKAADPPPVALASAAEATDPTVHQVLAELQTARSNGDDEAVQALIGRLADLGYE